MSRIAEVYSNYCNQTHFQLPRGLPVSKKLFNRDIYTWQARLGSRVPTNDYSNKNCQDLRSNQQYETYKTKAWHAIFMWSPSIVDESEACLIV